MNHALPTRSDTYPLDADTQELFDKLYVCPARLWQLLELRRFRNVALPAGQGRVLDFYLRQQFQVGWQKSSRDPTAEQGDLISVFSKDSLLFPALTREASELFAVADIARGDLDLLEVVQHVQLGQVDARVPVDQRRVAQHNKVQPATSPSPAGRRAVLGPDLLHVLANVLPRRCKSVCSVSETCVNCLSTRGFVLTSVSSVGKGPPPTRVV